MSTAAEQQFCGGFVYEVICPRPICATQMGEKGGKSCIQAAHPLKEKRKKRGNRFPHSLSKSA
jgi:hypothetical protein